MHWRGQVFRLRNPFQWKMLHRCRSFRHQPNVCTLLVGAILLIVLHWLIRLEMQDDAVAYFATLRIPDDPDFVPFGIDHAEDLPEKGIARIPRRIHQTWKSSTVPTTLQPWIESWMKMHPDWEYWLWTDDSARELLKNKYPSLLAVFDNYSENIRRADALRYVVLYEYGGVYADMDMESLKPLDPLIRKYACFLGQEPYEHSVMDTNFQGLVINALMGCRAGHPFFKLLVSILPDFSHMWNVLDSTGPHFITYAYRVYQKSQPGYPADHINGTYLAPAEYFYPTSDSNKYMNMLWMCQNYHSLTPLQQRGCQSLKRLKPLAERMSLAFTVHHWIHTYLTIRVTLRGSVAIQEIVPKVVVYGRAS